MHGNALDNRWEKLREATHTENMQNRKTYRNTKLGVKGVCMNGKYIQSRIRINGKLKHLGYFKTIELAKAAYDAAATAHFGQFARPK